MQLSISQVLTHGDYFDSNVVVPRHRPTNNRGPWLIDPLFPQRVTGSIDVAGIDEGMAVFFTGLVRALRPLKVFETGTHLGRSTRALADGLVQNGQGQLWTVDCVDHHIYQSGALTPEQRLRVMAIIGESPGILSEPTLTDLTGIDLAFLDGDHTGAVLTAELEYVDQHRAPECWVLVENARDEMWPEVQQVMAQYTRHPWVSLDTMCGLVIIQMRD